MCALRAQLDHFDLDSAPLTSFARISASPALGAIALDASQFRYKFMLCMCLVQGNMCSQVLANTHHKLVSTDYSRMLTVV